MVEPRIPVLDGDSKVGTAFVIDADVLRLLGQYAKNSGISRSAVVEGALSRLFLSHPEKLDEKLHED